MGWSRFKTYLVSSHGRYLDRAVDTKLVSELISRLRPFHYGFPPMRLGPGGDGGYVVPSVVSECDVCFSAGVADSVHFEIDLFKRFGIPAALADYSVDAPSGLPLQFSFTKKFVTATRSSSSMTLDEWVDREKARNKRLIVQMDIEGAEFEVLLNASTELMQKIDVLVLEFHGLERLLSRAFFPIGKALIDRLLEFFNVYHLHPNNVGSVAAAGDGIRVPSLLEITFLSKRVCGERSPGPVALLPLEIDSPNKSSLPDIKLDRPWVL